MALSDQLMDLAGRTKRLEEAAAAARASHAAKMEERKSEQSVEAAKFYADASAEFASSVAALAAFAADAAAEANTDAGLARKQADAMTTTQAPVVS